MIGSLERMATERAVIATTGALLALALGSDAAAVPGRALGTAGIPASGAAIRQLRAAGPPHHELVQVHAPVSATATAPVHRAGGQTVGYLPAAASLVELQRPAPRCAAQDGVRPSSSR